MPEGIWLVNLNTRRQNRLDRIRLFARKQNSSSAGTINDSKRMGLWKQIFLCLQTIRSEAVRTDYSATFNVNLHVWKKRMPLFPLDIWKGYQEFWMVRIKQISKQKSFYENWSMDQEQNQSDYVSSCSCLSEIQPCCDIIHCSRQKSFSDNLS